MNRTTYAYLGSRERVNFMGKTQFQMWMPVGVPIVAMNNRGDNMPMMTSDMDEDIIEEDYGPGLACEEPEDVTDIDTFGLNDTEPAVMDDLGLHNVVNAAAEEPSDASEEHTDEDIMEDNTELTLGDWVNLPRQSRRIARLNPIDPQMIPTMWKA